MVGTIDLLNGRYVILPTYRSTGAILAEIHHVHRAGDTSFYTPVARISAFVHPGADMTYPHWSIRVFVRTDVRYEASSNVTTVVSEPERQAGSNTTLLAHLLALRDGELPLVCPQLPQALGDALISTGICTEPAAVHMHTETEGDFVEWGRVFHDDDT